jgi:hypothetical protein
MFSAAMTSRCTGTGMLRLLPAPRSTACIAQSRQRCSPVMSLISTGSPPSTAAKHGPYPRSYCRSSRSVASRPVEATVVALPRSTSVTDTSEAPGIVCLVSWAIVAITDSSDCSDSVIRASSAKASCG